MEVKRVRMKGWRNLEDTDYAYFAGLIDADGTISIKCTPRDYCVPIIGMRTASKLALLIGQKYGGALNRGKQNATLEARDGYKRSDTYLWGEPKQTEQRKILTHILPYLQLKTDRAKLALQMLDVLAARAEGWKEQTRELAAKIRKLNRKGQPLPDTDLELLAQQTLMVKRQRRRR